MNFLSAADKLASVSRDSLLRSKERYGWRIPEFDHKGDWTILMYHGVVPERPAKFNWRHVSTIDFECHLRMLQKYCNIISLKDLHAENLCQDRLNVALTFDDGYRNNYQCALPLLEKYKAPASFFITGANEIGMPYLWPDFLDILSRHADDPVQIEDLVFVKKGKVFVEEKGGESLASIIKHVRPNWAFKNAMFDAFRRWVPNLFRPDYRPYWALMSDAEIRAASDSEWVTVGCHGYYHNNLGELPLNDALNEVEKGCRYLERVTAKQATEIAFPDGSYSKELIDAIGPTGLEVMLGTEHRFDESQECSTPYRRTGIYSYLPRATQLVSAMAGDRESAS